MKRCIECNDDKAASEFYGDGRGGLAGICKGCHKARMKLRRLTNPKVQEYDRARAKTPERRERAFKITVQWRKDHPEGYRAQNAVNNAIRRNRINKGPCSICGATQDVHGHHKDYAKPLDVVWLCAKCHHRVHATFPELGGHFQAAE